MFALLILTILPIAISTAIPMSRLNFVDQLIPPNYDGRIINGTKTTIEKNPHQISVQMSYSGHVCGGSIISKNWVLTAAHCVDIKYADYVILSGTTSLSEGGTFHEISEIIIHEDFYYNDYGNPKYDVALLRVRKPFKFGKTRKSIPLFERKEETRVGSIAVITGWGLTINGHPDILNRVAIPIISKERCNDQHEEVGGIDEGEICAYEEEGSKDSCSGDSGGPLSVDGRLAGIVSWGDGCALPDKAGVYTEISHYRYWIEKHSGV